MPITKWTQVATLYSNSGDINSICVFNNKIYAGANRGRLLEWNDVDAWIEVAPVSDSQTGINSIVVFNNELYAGTSSHGHLFKWNGVDAWIEVATKYGTYTSIISICIFNGKIYGVGTDAGFNNSLLEWNGSNAWVEVAPRLNDEVAHSLVVYNNKLYCGTTPYAMGAGGALLEWNGSDAWVEVAGQPAQQEVIHSLCVYNNKLYGGGGGSVAGGKLYEWNDVDAWIEVAPELGSQTAILSLIVFDSKLYAGTASHGHLFQWNDVDAWIEVAPQLNSQTYANTLTIYNNRLYCGTKSGGRLFLGDGDSVTYNISAGDSVLLSESVIKSIKTNKSDSTSLVDRIFHRISQGDSNTLHFLDSISKLFRTYRFDNVDFQDNLNRVHALATFSDSLPLSDSHIHRLTKNISENLSIIDAVNYCVDYILGVVRYLNASDALPISDSYTKAFNVKLNDNISILDFVEGLCLYSPLIRHLFASDTVTIADTLSKSLRKSYNENLSVTEKITNFIFHKKPSDSVLLSDALNRIVQSLQTDSVLISDSLIQGWIQSILISDTVDINDSIAYSLLKQLLSSLPLSDVISGKTIGITLPAPPSQGHPPHDTLFLTDDIAKRLSSYKSDSVLLSDANIKSWHGYPSDSAVISDTTTKNIQPSKNELLTLWDRICYQISSIGWNIGTESLLLLDRVSKTMGLYKFESIDIYETLHKFFNKQPYDYISLSDSIVKRFSKLNNDQLLILDNLSRLLSMGGFTDQIGIVDRLNRLLPLFASDSIPISDSLLATWIKNLNDIIVPQDTIVQKVFKKVVNTPVALYDALQKQVRKLLGDNIPIVDVPDIDEFNAAPPTKARKETVVKIPEEEEWHDITSIQRRGPK